MAADPLSFCEPEDLIRFGLIPEFVGRLPVATALTALDKAALVRILTEPRNALIRQYQRLLAMENVELTFTPGAIEALAERAVERGTGARGLRAILEDLMLNVMYEIPSRKEVRSCRITADTVRSGRPPVLA